VIPVIIPARGGSKGVPKKNIIPFLGNPLVSYTIEQAKASKMIDEVFVSTDSDEIAAVSREWDAKIIDRPSNLARDDSPTEPVLVHAMETLRDRDYDPDTIVLLQCTSPMRMPADITDAVSRVTKKGYDSAFSCCEDHSFFWKSTDNGAEPINYDPKRRQRRQDLATQYRENGSIYVTDTQLLVQEECRLGGQIAVHEMPQLMSLEIDTPEDLRMTEAVAREVDFYTGDAIIEGE